MFIWEDFRTFMLVLGISQMMVNTIALITKVQVPFYTYSVFVYDFHAESS